MRWPKSVLLAVLVLVSLVESPLSAHTKGPATEALAHARVVSLSLVEGAVIVRKPGSAKWNRAGLDMSVEQGMSIATARNSLAEVQFENGSTLRIGELSRIDFTEMALAVRGTRVNRINLAFGLTTANVVPGPHDEYVLDAADTALTPRGKAEFRVDILHNLLRVEVFRGRLDAADSNQTESLNKNQVLARDGVSPGPFQVTNPIHADTWDKWVRERDGQAALAAYQDNAAMDARLNDWSHVVPPPGLFTGGIIDDGF